MDLPKVFQNRNIENIENAQHYFYSSNNSTNNNISTKKTNIDLKINNIFKSNKFLYKINVIIKTNDGDIDTTIIGKTNKNLITIKNDLIPIKDILDINIK